MKTKVENQFFIAGLFTSFGVMSWLMIPFTYWFIHGSYERYLWIIGGAAPFSDFGSSSIQLFIFIIFGLLGLLCIIPSTRFYFK